MIDTELFELCRELYKRTGWDSYELAKDHVTTSDGYDEWDLPLYTSDYLLDKLPHASYQMDVTSVGVKLTTFYTDDKWETVHADTPLKALLKLVIALDDAKEIPNV